MMIDAEIKRKKTICEVAGVKDYQRMMLFAALVKQNRDKAWKSLRHEDGELCFGGGWFVVGIDTPEGSYTYHYEDKYFGIFDCIELERGKHWDGHTEEDVTRLLSLEQEPYDDCISRRAALEKAINVPIAKVVTEDEVIYRKIIFADDIEKLPPVVPHLKMKNCKDCKYFEYDSVANVYGIPLIVAHEICSRWGDGCKTKEDGYCFLFEPQESEVNK